MSGQDVLDGTALDRLRSIGGENLVRRMVELYLTNGPERIRGLTDASAAGDAGGVERTAHMMKSSAGNLGAVRLQHAAEALEVAVAAGSIDEELVARVVREYDESAAALARLLKERPS